MIVNLIMNWIIIKPFDKLLIDKLIESEKCQDVPLINNKNYIVTSYKMKHVITSYGYIIYEKRTKLKKEYIDKKGHEIKQLKDNGIIIQDIMNSPTIAFTGDTTIDAVLDNEDMLNSKILLMECTHFDDTIENATKHGHIHFDQIVKNIHKFKNKWIILIHLSQKYKKRDDIIDYLKVLSEDDLKRIIVWI